VVAWRGRDYLHRLWQGPEAMPTLAEIRAPETWIARMEMSATV
jgi:uncharacterized protein (DUF2342 family)